MDKRNKKNIGFKLHPVKKILLRVYAEERGITVQKVLEDYVDNLIGYNNEKLETIKDKKEKFKRTYQEAFNHLMIYNFLKDLQIHLSDKENEC